MRWARGFGSHVSEAPRRETPCQGESGTVVSHHATRPCGEHIRCLSKGVARPWQSRHRGRCHVCIWSCPQLRKVCCAPSVGEGRNTMLRRRSRCAYPVSESVHDRLGSSDEDRGGERRHSQRPLVLVTLVHVTWSDPVVDGHIGLVSTAPTALTDDVHA